MNPTRIGIRGVAGLLGSRIAAAIQKTKDMALTVGVVLADRTLDALMARKEFVPGLMSSLPQKLFVQSRNGGENELATNLTEKWGVPFQGLSQLSWRRNCDVIVDIAYPAGKEVVAESYGNFRGVIIVQDGATPEGRLIVPPLVAPENGDRKYRMGDCILSGVVPLFYPFREMAKTIRVNLLTQFDGREADYLIVERANAFYLRDDLREKVARDLGVLFPKQEINVAAVIQIPSLLHYQITLEIELESAISAKDLRDLLRKMPRVCLLPSQVSSTYDLNLGRSINEQIPPITVFESALEPKEGESKTVRLVAALYYRTAAVLPNLDAIRILAEGMDPLEAMRQTDKDMGFVSS